MMISMEEDTNDLCLSAYPMDVRRYTSACHPDFAKVFVYVSCITTIVIQTPSTILFVLFWVGRTSVERSMRYLNTVFK